MNEVVGMAAHCACRSALARGGVPAAGSAASFAAGSARGAFAPATDGVGRPAPEVPFGGGPSVSETLGSIWRRFVDFLRRLFGAGEPVPPASAWPAYNPDARRQIAEMFPTGRGMALGFVPVRVWRQGGAVYGTASGYGGGALFWSNGDLYYQQEGKAPGRVAAARSTRDGNGDTHFEVFLESGKAIRADILADGRTVRHRGYQVTLY